VELARGGGTDFPDMTDAALIATLEDWLLPHLGRARTEADLRAFDTTNALKAMLDWDQTQRLDTLVPAHFNTPLGRHVPIDYDGEAPAIEVRLQEMFGVTRHPVVGAARLPMCARTCAGHTRATLGPKTRPWPNPPCAPNPAAPDRTIFLRKITIRSVCEGLATDLRRRSSLLKFRRNFARRARRHPHRPESWAKI
jgi:hypothetical protein